MLTKTVANVGDSVTFKLWVRPYSILIGKIVKVERDQFKQAKYIIKPNERVPEITKETTYRYHPYNPEKPELDDIQDVVTEN